MSLFSKILLFGILIFVSSFGSCQRCGPFPDKYNVIDIIPIISELTFLDEDNTTYNKQNYNGTPLNYRNVLIELSSTYSTYYSSISKKTPCTSALLACSPVEPNSEEIIQDIVITSTTDYSGEYLAGSNLAAIFDVKYEDFTNPLSGSLMSLPDYLASNPFSFTNLSLFLNEEPDADLNLNLTINYLQDGKEIDQILIELPSISVKL